MGRSELPAIAVAVLTVALFAQGTSSLASSELAAVEQHPGVADRDRAPSPAAA